MAREFKRTDRVAEQVQREIAQIIQLELRDPRVGMVTVCAVDLSRDLHYATVYVTFLGIDETPKATNEAIETLNDAASFIRTLIGKRMKLRAVPHVKFVFDKSISRGRELSSLIEQAREKDSSLENDTQSKSPGDADVPNDTDLGKE